MIIWWFECIPEWQLHGQMPKLMRKCREIQYHKCPLDFGFKKHSIQKAPSALSKYKFSNCFCTRSKEELMPHHALKIMFPQGGFRRRWCCQCITASNYGCLSFLSFTQTSSTLKELGLFWVPSSDVLDQPIALNH